MKAENFLKIAIWAVIALCVVALTVNSLKDTGNFGSIETGQGYNATTTDQIGIRTSRIIKTGGGMLGSVVINKAGNMGFNLYDATTTIAHGRYDTHKATSSILLATIAPSQTAGTYIFDVEFTDGLYIDLIDASANQYASTTITYR